MQAQKDVAGPGNQQVIDLFERWLERAKEGKITYAALTVCQPPNRADYDCGGQIALESVANHAIKKLQDKLDVRITNRFPPTRDFDLDASYACYNMAANPASFDFLTWLVDAEMTRKRLGAPAPLKVGFWAAKDCPGLTTDYYRMMFEEIARPLLGFIGAVEDEAAVGGRSKKFFGYRDVTAAVTKGEQVPRLKPSQKAMDTVAECLKGGSVPITITLREAEYWPHRNSSIPEWLKFADHLEACGERVVLIRDTVKAMDPIAGRNTWAAASLNLDVRMALYEQAKCNFFVANGPWNLALFGTKPWLMFIETKTEEAFLPNRPEWWQSCHGINVGEQFPWCDENQKIIWKTDSCDNIQQAWHELGRWGPPGRLRFCNSK